MRSRRASQNGNVLWFILVAIALLGAITMVLSGGTSSVEQTGDYERRSINISQLMRYASGIEQAVAQLTMNGCSENDISFQNTIVAGYGAGTADCRVFETTGVGLSWQEDTGEVANLLDSRGLYFTGDLGISNVGRGTLSHLTMLAAVTQSMCSQINSAVGTSVSTETDITAGGLNTVDKFDGDYSTFFDVVAAGASALDGKKTGCLKDDNNDYIFYHVLIAR